MPTCLVTGAAGFIGSNLCDRLLAEGYRVIGLDSLDESYDVRLKRLNLDDAVRNPRFSFVLGDLRYINLNSLLAGTDLVFHLAGAVRPECAEARFALTERLVDGLGSSSVRAFVHASSWSVDGAAAPPEVNAPFAPSSPFRFDGLGAESVALRRASEQGIRVMAARYLHVYGPRQRPDMMVEQLIAAAIEERVASLPDLSRTRDLLFVDDAVEMTLAIAQGGMPGRVYDIGSGCAKPLSEVVEHVERATGRSIVTARLPARDGEYRQVRLASERFDTGKADAEVGLAAGIAAQFAAHVARRNALAVWSRVPQVAPRGFRYSCENAYVLPADARAHVAEDGALALPMFAPGTR